MNNLGIVYSKTNTSFKMFSPNTGDVNLKLYNSYDALIPSYEYKLTRDGDFVSITLDGDYNNYYYLLNVCGLDTLDPYCKACSINGEKGYICDLSVTDPIGFREEKFIRPRTPIIYEMHVRDFTSDVTIKIPSNERGKFAGIKENIKTFNGLTSGIDYLVELGVTYVHLLPIYDYGSVDERTSEPYNWGYDPVNYNCLEGSYSTNPYDPLTRIREFKELVQRLHKNNIGVILDVVYNHTYSTNSPLNLTAPNYYYRMKDGIFSNASGCGNETRSDAPMYHDFMIDSIKYFVEEYHIDGFRFDLMGIHDVKTMNDIRYMLNNIYPDGSGKTILMYGEPWFCNQSLCEYEPANLDNVNKLDNNIAVFNPTFRDSMRGRHFGGLKKGYSQGIKSLLPQLRYAIAGATKKNASPRLNSYTQQVLYCSCHDDHTLFDHITLTCDDWETIITTCKMCATATLSALGMSFFQAGEEFFKTKSMYKNSYNKSDYINKLDWMRREEFDDVVKFYKGLIELRKNNEVFTLDNLNPDFEIIDPKSDVLAYRAGKIIYIINPTSHEYALDVEKYSKLYKIADLKGFKKELLTTNIVNSGDILIIQIGE